MTNERGGFLSRGPLGRGPGRARLSAPGVSGRRASLARGKGGEIDLITRDGEGFVFVEVKKSRSHARAAERLSMRQIRRLYDAAAEFLAQCPRGLNTLARFDVALVDGNGRIEILENALCA